MKCMRYLLAAWLFTFAVQVQADDWLGSDISDVLDKVRSIYGEVTGDVKDAAQDLVQQQQMRTEAIKETVGDLLMWLEHRRAPFLDFVNGGAGRCGQGSACEQFRADLKSFALDIADLKDRFPVLEQNGLGDTTLFADATDILPPFVLFGLYEILERVPDWQSLPVDLADFFDEIGDPEVFSVGIQPSAQVAVVSVKARSLPGFGPTISPAEDFCSKGKEPLLDPVRSNRLKALLFRWKNRFDSFSEYPPDEANISLVGEGGGAVKIPAKAFLKSVSNAIDSILNLADTYRANLDVCKRIETDVAQCTPLAEYRTSAGTRMAYWVVYGIVNRRSTADAKLNTTAAKQQLDEAAFYYGNSNWKQTYTQICRAYAAL